MNNGSIYMLIGAMRKVARLSDGTAGTLTIQEALILVSDQIEDGMEAHSQGITESLTYEETLNGCFMGKKKEKPRVFRWFSGVCS